MANLSKLYNMGIPIKATDHINNVNDKIHEQLFNEAIAKYFEVNKDTLNKSNYKIIDLKNNINDFWASDALLIDKTSKEKIKVISLFSYWNTNYNYITDDKNIIMNELLISDENKKNNKVINIDYINGTVKFKNKFTDKEFEVKFEKLDKTPKLDSELIKSTFKYKQIFGNE